MARLIATFKHMKRDDEGSWRAVAVVVADVSFPVDPDDERQALEGDRDALKRIIGMARLQAFAEASRIVARR